MAGDCQGFYAGKASQVSSKASGSLPISHQACQPTSSANRSLIRFAGDSIFRASKRLLITDLAWPPYIRALRRRAHRHGAAVHLLPLSNLIFRDHANAQQVAQHLCEAYVAHDCDSLFITDITNRGVRLPLELVIRAVRKTQPAFVVVDGAQALNHRPVDLASIDCDLYLAGTHKWFGAYHPLRIALIGRHGANLSIDGAAPPKSPPRLHDPLAMFCETLEGRKSAAYGETVNLLPLITAAGALNYNLRTDISRCWENRRHNAQELSSWLEGTAQPQRIDPSLRTGIVLVATPLEPGCARLARRRLLEQGAVVASVLPSGLVRLAMPSYAIPMRFMLSVVKAIYRMRLRELEVLEQVITTGNFNVVLGE